MRDEEVELAEGTVLEWVARESLTQNEVAFASHLKEVRKGCTEIAGRKRAGGRARPVRGPGPGAHRGWWLPPGVNVWA